MKNKPIILLDFDFMILAEIQFNNCWNNSSLYNMFAFAYHGKCRNVKIGFDHSGGIYLLIKAGNFSEPILSKPHLTLWQRMLNLLL